MGRDQQLGDEEAHHEDKGQGGRGVDQDGRAHNDEINANVQHDQQPVAHSMLALCAHQQDVRQQECGQPQDEQNLCSEKKKPQTRVARTCNRARDALTRNMF